MTTPTHRIGRCVHCNHQSACLTSRLCQTCYKNLDIRAKYPRLIESQPQQEPTEEELERTIAEQMQCLPPDWESWRDHDFAPSGLPMKPRPRKRGMV